MRINLYAQNRHTLVLDGIPMSDFSDGDFIQIKADGNAASRTQGGDGPGMNISTDQGGSIHISLKPTSPVLGILYELRKQQQNNPRMFSFMVMTGVDEVISAMGCAFGELPQAQTGGPTMQGRQFALECLRVEWDPSGVEPAEGGMIPLAFPV